MRTSEMFTTLTEEDEGGIDLEYAHIHVKKAGTCDMRRAGPNQSHIQNNIQSNKRTERMSRVPASSTPLKKNFQNLARSRSDCWHISESSFISTEKSRRSHPWPDNKIDNAMVTRIVPWVGNSLASSGWEDATEELAHLPHARILLLLWDMIESFAGRPDAGSDGQP
ncbi:hypothetical protein BDZ45DRAFT_740819 [Acephala macrosclerotiorum]|nr:hypothetical protein BDZ45DRAFT_740819 [Acephala macrosclerotiorum]